MENQPLFIDGVKKINFIGGVLRMELFCNQPTEYDENNTEVVGQLVMSPDGFVSMINALQGAADMLVQNGVLSKGAENAESKENN